MAASTTLSRTRLLPPPFKSKPLIRRETFAQEKFDLEAECERLVGSTASLEAEAKHAHQDLSVHRNALRALEESVTSSLAEPASAEDLDNLIVNNKSISTPVLARCLASSKLVESSALGKLQKVAHNEVKLKVQAH